MGRFRQPVVVGAVAVAVSAVGLFVVRSSLAQARSSLEETRADRDRAWDRYLLSEQRSSAADVLIVGSDPFGIARAVAHARGAVVAISAAADEQIPAIARTVLGGEDEPLLESRLARDLSQGGYGEYQRYQQAIGPLQRKALENVDAHGQELRRLEARIGLLTNLETVAFLLTVFCALLLNVLSARRDGG